MTGDEDRERGSLNHAWHVHSVLDSWTGKVDTKASIALALESASFGFVLTLSETDRTFSGLAGNEQVFYRAGLGLLLIAVFFSMAVVVPRLNRRATRRNWRGNRIYFGHLRFWDPSDLAKAIENDDENTLQLSKQLVAMSKIAWRKHSLLQISFAAYALAIAFLILAA